MDRADTAKLKKALIDAFMLDAEEAIGRCPPPVTVSEAHEKRMREILSSKTRRRISYRKVGKRVIALLVAALLIFLTGCALFYQKIVDFFVTVFDGYSRVEQSVQTEEYPQSIEEIMIPTVMPEGYELTEQFTNEFSVRMKWGNINGERITFSQTIISGIFYAIDNEDGAYVKMDVGEYEILKYFHGELHTYVWRDEYQFSIMSSCELSEIELLKIIDSIQ